VRTDGQASAKGVAIMDGQHRVAARYYATLYSDLSTVRVHINREFCTRYTLADIERMVNTGQLEPKRRGPSQLSAEPIAMHKPITTLRGGMDPLAVATNAYLQKHRRAILKSLKA
jgi:hypothetical protein